MIYRVETNKGPYFWGTNQSNWQAGFQSNFPGVQIKSAAPISVDQAPANYRSVLTPFNQSPPPTTAPAQPTTATTPSTPTAVQAVQDSMDRVQQQWLDKATQYDSAHPFSFDESLATAAAKQQNDPYYQQKLSDFLQGVTTQRSRSLEDEQNVLNDLKATTTSFQGKTQDTLNRALNASEQGFADSGLFFSGQRIAADTNATNDSNRNLTDFLQGQNTRQTVATNTYNRTNEDLNTSTAQTTRDLNTNEQADIQKDVNTARSTAYAKAALERNQFLGPAPGETADSFDAANQGILKGLYG